MGKTHDKYMLYEHRAKAFPKIDKSIKEVRRFKRNLVLGAIAGAILIYSGCEYISKKALENSVRAMEKEAAELISLREKNQLSGNYADSEASMIDYRISKLYEDNSLSARAYTDRLENIRSGLRHANLLPEKTNN